MPQPEERSSIICILVKRNKLVRHRDEIVVDRCHRQRQVQYPTLLLIIKMARPDDRRCGWMYGRCRDRCRGSDMFFLLASGHWARHDHPFCYLRGVRCADSELRNSRGLTAQTVAIVPTTPPAISICRGPRVLLKIIPLNVPAMIVLAASCWPLT